MYGRVHHETMVKNKLFDCGLPGVLKRSTIKVKNFGVLFFEIKGDLDAPPSGVENFDFD